MYVKTHDSSIFSSYNEESCYWAGFLAADGHIDINGTICFELKDKEAVEDFREYCSASNILSYNPARGSYRVRFVDKKVQEDLLYNFNVSSDKTFNLTVPILETKENYAAYYRGFFDGDGCLTEFFNNRPTASFRVFLTSGAIDFIEQTLELLRNYGIVTGGSIQKKATNCWHIQLGIRDATSFLNWIYASEGPRLIRKYEKYCNLIVLNNRAHI